ncbi:MAG: hypothetical protein WCI46_08965, partial [Verrucomicrobiota bacterium]
PVPVSPVPVSPVPVSPVPPVPVPLPNDLVRLQLTELKAVLDFYERLTKKRLVYDAQAAGPTPITIAVNGEISRDEAIRIIEISLILNGITLVPVDRSDIVKVIGVGKNPRSAAIPIISDEGAIPDGEQVITFLAKLQYADPAELTQTLGAFVVQSQGQYTNLTPLPKSQSILITENTAVIRGLLKIIHEVDIRPADVDSVFLSLERADAKDVLEKLTAIFEKQPAPGGAPGANIPRAIQVPRPSNTTPDGIQLPAGATAEVTSPNSVEIRSGSLSEDAIIVGKIKLTADIRTNRIHVVTRPVNLPFIRKLIAEFDSSVKFGEPVARPLKFISAADVIDVIVKSITEPGMKEDGSAGATQGNRAGALAGAAGRAVGLGGGLGNGNSGSSSGSGDLNVSEKLQVDLVDTKPDARIVGTTKLIADKNANAIIVIGNADVRAKVFKLLDQLDRRIPQVMLHAVIGELNLSQKEQFGVDYIIRSAGLGITPVVVNPGTVTTNPGAGAVITPGGTVGNGNTSTVTGTGTTVGQTATNLVSVNSSNKPLLDLNNLLKQDNVRQIATAGASGLTGFFTAGNSMTAIVTALENTGRFTVINRPSVFTRNNKKAIIASGQEIAVPVNIQSSVNSVSNGNAGIVSNSSVQYKNVTLQLEVVPLINSDKEVSLDILQSNNEVSGFTRIDNNDIPTIATRYVRTSVTVPNEATLVLGGLIKTSTNRAKSGIPFLSNIPVLGLLFSNTSKEKVRNELVILIRPVVTWAPADAIDLRQREMEFLNIPPDMESTIYPDVKRQKVFTEPPLRKPPVSLRDPTPAPRKKSVAP